MKSKPPKEIQERRAPQPKPKKEQQSPKGSIWKTVLKIVEWFFGIGIGLAGLTLTALQYQARPTASLGTPLNPSDVLTTKITISNEGLTDLENVTFESYFKDVRIGGIHVWDQSGAQPRDAVSILQTGEKQDILPWQVIKFTNPSAAPTLESLDFAIIVKFRPAYWPMTKRRFFRFRFFRNSDGTNSLRQIAAGDIEKDYDKYMEHMAQMEQSFPRHARP